MARGRTRKYIHGEERKEARRAQIRENVRLFRDRKRNQINVVRGNREQHAIQLRNHGIGFHSSLAAIDLTFGSLHQLAYDMEFCDRMQFPRHGLATASSQRDQCLVGTRAAFRLVDIAILTIGSLRLGLGTQNQALLDRAEQGKNALVQRLSICIANIDDNSPSLTLPILVAIEARFDISCLEQSRQTRSEILQRDLNRKPMYHALASLINRT